MRALGVKRLRGSVFRVQGFERAKGSLRFKGLGGFGGLECKNQFWHCAKNDIAELKSEGLANTKLKGI